MGKRVAREGSDLNVFPFSHIELAASNLAATPRTLIYFLVFASDEKKNASRSEESNMKINMRGIALSGFVEGGNIYFCSNYYVLISFIGIWAFVGK